jgi:hypothetical protein
VVGCVVECHGSPNQPYRTRLQARERGMAVSPFKWARELDDIADGSDFLQENQAGANVGEIAGAGAAVVGVGVGLGYAALATAPAAAVAQAEAAAVIAAGGAPAVACKIGDWAGRKTAQKLLRSTLGAAIDLGGFAGKYTGAAVQAGARSVGEMIEEVQSDLGWV